MQDPQQLPFDLITEGFFYDFCDSFAIPKAPFAPAYEKFINYLIAKYEFSAQSTSSLEQDFDDQTFIEASCCDKVMAVDGCFFIFNTAKTIFSLANLLTLEEAEIKKIATNLQKIQVVLIQTKAGKPKF